MKKINISHNDIHTLVMESVKKCLKELYDRNKFYEYNSGISDNKEFIYLENLVGNFASETIEYNEETGHADFENFIKGLAILKAMSEEKAMFDEMHIKEVYQQYISEGREDDFWNLEEVNDFEYIENYVGEYAKTELWDKYMPAPQRIDYLITEFKDSLKFYIEFNIESYQREMWSEYKYYMRELERI